MKLPSHLKDLDAVVGNKLYLEITKHNYKMF